MINENTQLDQTLIADGLIRPHTLLLNTYEVEQFLKEGGMGRIYLAHHKELNTKHIIKIIKPELAMASARINLLELFKREAYTLRSIHHDAIVGYDGFQRDERYGHCLIMEYVQGPSLKELLQQRSFVTAEVWQLRNRLADGLAAAHAKGIIHRDLAPDNVILPEENVANAKLIDFGISKQCDPTIGTIIGPFFAGKWGYVAPEQLGLFGGEIGPCSDIYSLGLVLAEAAIGSSLMMGNSLETAIQARRTVPDLSRVPAELRPQLSAMLQPNPADRPQTMAELLRRWPYPPPPGKGVLQKYKIYLISTLSIIIIMVAILMLMPILHTWTRFFYNTCDSSLTEIRQYPPEQIYECARQFYDKGDKEQLEQALLLWEHAAKQGHGPSELALGQLYDPVLGDKIPSPFTKRNPYQAEKWYKLAREHGIGEADIYLQNLDLWKREHPEAGQ